MKSHEPAEKWFAIIGDASGSHDVPDPSRLIGIERTVRMRMLAESPIPGMVMPWARAQGRWPATATRHKQATSLDCKDIIRLMICLTYWLSVALTMLRVTRAGTAPGFGSGILDNLLGRLEHRRLSGEPEPGEAVSRFRVPDDYATSAFDQVAKRSQPRFDRTVVRLRRCFDSARRLHRKFGQQCAMRG